ncbi:MAG: hypothetical protein JXA19_01440 [Anaerolineales bacterium]|nr:hypothetical protein [Anaerolineales bacterium]
MQYAVTPDDLALVAIMPSPRDMEIARLLGWYRIPLVTAPKVIEVDTIAFYQPASFGERKWCVEVVAPVLGHELVLRKDLIKEEADHPKANEEYFKIQIGEMVPLPKPILAGKWKRVNFIYTTGERLLTAQELADLPVTNENERRVLWRSLRERALDEQRYRVDELPEFPIDSELLALLGMLSGGSSNF